MKTVLITISVLAAMWCAATLLPLITGMALFIISVVLLGSVMLD
jgi:hypothetical protein